MIAFYYLLRVGEYTVNGSRNLNMQTVQFKYKEVTFFHKNYRGRLRWLPHITTDSLTATADGANLKLDNQKNSWKAICVCHKANDDDTHCPIQALSGRYMHLQHHGAKAKTFLLAYYNKVGQRFDITNQDVSAASKLAATFLDYPTTISIPINQIDTHLLRSNGANALLMTGYSNTQIQKNE
jgi:hypothetical protein